MAPVTATVLGTYPRLAVSDAAAALAERGGRVVFPVTDHPYGRAGRVEDAYGHQWMVIRPV